MNILMITSSPEYARRLQKEIDSTRRTFKAISIGAMICGYQADRILLTPCADSVLSQSGQAELDKRSKLAQEWFNEVALLRLAPNGKIVRL